MENHVMQAVKHALMVAALTVEFKTGLKAWVLGDPLLEKAAGTLN